MFITRRVYAAAFEVYARHLAQCDWQPDNKRENLNAITTHCQELEMDDGYAANGAVFGVPVLVFNRLLLHPCKLVKQQDAEEEGPNADGDREAPART